MKTITPPTQKYILNKDNYFAMIPEWVLYSSISANAIRLYCVLARYADKNSGDCFPSRSTITEVSGLSPRNISAAVKELQDLGALLVKRRFTDVGGYQSNLYTVITAKPLMQDDTTPLMQDDTTLSADLHLPLSADLHLPLVQNCTHPRCKSAPLTKVIELESINESHLKKEINIIADAINPIFEELAIHLSQRIEENGSKKPTISEKWITDIRLLIERDGRTPEQVRRAIDWAQNDSFWRSNILSPAKLRLKYDQLRLNAEFKTRQNEPKGLAAIVKVRSEEESTEEQLVELMPWDMPSRSDTIGELHAH